MKFKEEFAVSIGTDLISQQDIEKLFALKNDHVLKIIKQFVDLCKPSKITVISDSEEDIKYVVQKTLSIREEINLNVKGHTVRWIEMKDSKKY